MGQGGICFAGLFGSTLQVVASPWPEWADVRGAVRRPAKSIISSLPGIVCLVAQSCSNLCDPMNCNLPGSSVHGGSSGKNTRVGCHTLLQGIFPTQGSNPHLPHCRYILYCLSYQGSPRILEWIAYPFSRGTSQPRSQTGVPCIAGGFLTSWATREFFVVVYILINGATGGQKFHVYFSFLIMPCIF